MPNTQNEVDFLIVGAGAAGGIMARELSRSGFSVVVLEQGPYWHTADFHHDELEFAQSGALMNDVKKQPNTFRSSENEVAKPTHSVQYGRGVGGGTVHFTANYWRFHESDFRMRSIYGPVAGADLADWPITYADLEPYYTKVEWEIGVSGLAGSSPFDPPRSRPYPLPPLPIQSTGVLAERGAKKLGWTAFPAPMAILSKPYRGRSACMHCGFCEDYGCEMGAKSSTLVTMFPDAERTGHCEVRPHSYVRKIEVDRFGRATGVKYFDANRREVFQRAKAVVVCANGAETPRLLLMSKCNLFPDGLANSSGYVGKHFMTDMDTFAGALFEHPVNGYRAGVAVARVIHDFYDLDPNTGLIGGGGIDMRFDWCPISFALGGLPEDAPSWGPEYKHMLQEYFTHTAYVCAHQTSLPVPTNSISLDPTVKDEWGLPALRVTFKSHPADLELSRFFVARTNEFLDAAGATRRWNYPMGVDWPADHLMGTCRMGNDPKTSVVDAYHRTHDVPNLILVDGSSFVTSDHGQATMTIQALAFRAAEHVGAMARRGEL